MARWDILNRDNVRDAEPSPANESRPHDRNGTSPSVGRGPTESSSTARPERPERPAQSSPERSPDRRTQYRHGGRTFSLRGSEIAARQDIGAFRNVDARDLTRFDYDG